MSAIEKHGTLPTSIYALIPMVMAEIGAVSKDRRNEQQKYAFRGIEDFYKAAHPAFCRHGIFCAPEVIEHQAETFEKPGYEGKTTIWRHVTMKVRHRFFAPDGSYVDVVTCGEGLDNSDKATNKAMSGAMKYALIELFSVPTEDVEDSDRTTPEAGKATNGSNKPQAQRSFGKPEPVIQRREELPKQDPVPVVSDTIEQGQASNLHRSFRDALKKNLQPKADELLGTWLSRRGYVDIDGKPTAMKIPKAIFYDEREDAEQYARSL